MFRPCIDLREGRVVQIVGGTLTDHPSSDSTITNFRSDKPAEWFAAKYRADDVTGGHIIKLGPGNDVAARSALEAWPGGMHIGGGINAANAAKWLDAGASHIIVTSYLFADGEFSPTRLEGLVNTVGKDRLVIDLSCRWRDDAYWVVADRWQRFTSLKLDGETLNQLAASCAEFLVHGVDVEGLSQGIDQQLVALLAEICPIPCTYAGGAKSLADLHTVHQLSHGRVDLTIGSALDVFGGSGVSYDECVAFNQTHRDLP